MAELRPRAGRSPWRALYRPVGQRFVLAAIGPEAQHDPSGFARACVAATRRLDELEECRSWSSCRNLLTAEEVHERDMTNRAYRAEYERTRFANDIAIRVLRYRSEHGLTQTTFGQLVGIRQPHVARLESGEHEPSLSTLVRLAAALGEDFTIDIDSNGARLRESA